MPETHTDIDLDAPPPFRTIELDIVVGDKRTTEFMQTMGMFEGFKHIGYRTKMLMEIKPRADVATVVKALYIASQGKANPIIAIAATNVIGAAFAKEDVLFVSNGQSSWPLDEWRQIYGLAPQIGNCSVRCDLQAKTEQSEDITTTESAITPSTRRKTTANRSRLSSRAI